MKKINEMNATVASTGFGVAFPAKKNGKKTTKKEKGTSFAMRQSEKMLREAIRKIIFYSKMKFYEDRGRQYLEEQKLRGVIRALILEKSEKPMLPTTVDNFVRDAMDKIFTGFKKTFMAMPDKPDNRKKYVDTLAKYMKSFLSGLADQLAGKQVVAPEEPAPAPEAPPVGSQPVLPSDTASLEEVDGEAAAPEEPEDPEDQQNKMVNALAQQTSAGLQGAANTDSGRAGAIAAYDEDGPTFAGMVAPFVNKLDPDDRAKFIDTFVQSIILTGQAFETELADKQSQPAGGAPSGMEAGAAEAGANAAANMSKAV